MTSVAALPQGYHEFRGASRQNDVAFEDNSVAGKMRRFIGTNVDQFAHVLANGPLAVFVEGSGKPKRRVVWQRTKTGIEMIKARIDKFD